MDVRADELADLTEEEIDALPFGLIAVDAEGAILRYNAYESRMARLAKERVIGRNFFRDVAPCTAVREFQGRFERFVAADESAATAFDFVFEFPFGRQRVDITFLKSAKDRSVKILVNRYDDRP